MNKGTIARIVADRGFGFISQEGEEKDLFFHTTEVQGMDFKELKEGEAVTFEVGQGPRGAFAKNIQRA